LYPRDFVPAPFPKKKMTDVGLSSPLPMIAARSISKIPFDHKINLQIKFSRKFQPRFNFYSQKMDFTGRNLPKMIRVT